MQTFCCYRKVCFVITWLAMLQQYSLEISTTNMPLPPKLNINESSIDVPLNSTLYLQCSGEQRVSWGRRNRENRSEVTDLEGKFNIFPSDDETETVIELIFTSILQTGEYVCYYANGIITTSLYVFVNDDTRIFLPSQQFPFLLFHEGTSCTIPCIASMSQANVSLWRINGSNAVQVQLDSNLDYDRRSGFLVKNTTKVLKGRYFCLAETEDRTENRTFSIDILPVTHPPEIAIDKSNATYVLLNSTFSLRCKIKIKYGTLIGPFYWSYPVTDENRVINSGKTIRNLRTSKIISETLTILNAQKSDEGIYECKVTDHSKRESSSQVAVTIFEEPQAPKVTFTESSAIVTKERGEAVNFEAPFTVFPPTVNIRSLWTKDGEHLSASSSKYNSKTTQSEYKLQIVNLTAGDSGIYTVTAYTATESFNKSFHLQVKDIPVLKVSNTTCCFTPGEVYQLFCESNSFPVPVLQWFWTQNLKHRNEWVEISQAPYVNENRAILKFRQNSVTLVLNVTAQSSGYYICVGENQKGSSEKEVQFIVSDIKDGLEVRTDSLTPLEKTAFSISCHASRDLYSSLKWTWTQNDTEVTCSDGLRETKTLYSIVLELRFTELQKNNTGLYTCIAASNEGNYSHHKSLFLTVKGTQIPQFVGDKWGTELIKDYHDQLELDCAVNGSPPPTVIWYRDGQILNFNTTAARFESTSQKFVIDRLVDEDSGVYSCLAENSVGEVMRNVSLFVVGSKISAILSQNNFGSTHVLKLFAGIASFLFLILLLSLAKYIYWKKKRLFRLQAFNHQLFEEGQTEFYDPKLPLNDQVDLLPYDSRWEFSKENLKLGRVLGQGAFGRVLKAEAFGLNNDEVSSTVAVKMLKEKGDINQQKALIAELKILIHLGQHVNIVNLLGAVTKNISQGELLLMVEYCHYGNLRNFLLRHREKFVHDIDTFFPTVRFSKSSMEENATETTEIKYISTTETTVFAVENPGYRQRVHSNSTENSKRIGRSVSCSSNSGSKHYFKLDTYELITLSDLLCFAFQSACGMDYLASRKLIHRDLAARNVLLAEDKIVKICDFGLAKDCYKYDNYIKKGDGPLPIKWMAIESIRDHIFTTKSDVWSFGILMWEYFTLGSNPYPGIEIDEQFYIKLSDGYRMKKPDLCPDNVYEIMKECWKELPTERPGFNRLSERLGALLSNGVKQHYMDLNSTYIEMNKQQRPDYSNITSKEKQTEMNTSIKSTTTDFAIHLAPNNIPVARFSKCDTLPLCDERQRTLEEIFQNGVHQGQTTTLLSTEYLRMKESNYINEP